MQSDDFPALPVAAPSAGAGAGMFCVPLPSLGIKKGVRRRGEGANDLTKVSCCLRFPYGTEEGKGSMVEKGHLTMSRSVVQLSFQVDDSRRC